MIDQGAGGDLGDDDDAADDGAADDADSADAFALTAPAAGKAKARRAVRSNAPVELTAYSHPDKRRNNPEVGMVHADTDPDRPAKTWAYDPHIDPALQFDSQRAAIEALIDAALASGDADTMRAALADLKRRQAPYLNWAGKAERTSFDVDTVSLHVHERIDPATILSAIRKRLTAVNGVAEPVQPWLFEPPFEALPLRQALDFYGHDKGWANRLVAGDSLLVMNSLLQKEGMAGQVQMIYFDPPYGIKYGSNFQPFTYQRDVKDGTDADLTQEPEMIKAFRDTWELGIHSYLTYLRDRLLLARDLLSDSGSIFIQIGDENVDLIKNILDEIFGKKNFVSLITVQKTSSATSEYLSGTADYILFFAKNISSLKYKSILKEKSFETDGTEAYKFSELPSGARVRTSAIPATFPKAGIKSLRFSDMRSSRPPGDFPVDFYGRSIVPRVGYWKTGPQGFQRVIRANRCELGGSTLNYVRYLEDFPAFQINNVWSDLSSSVGGDKIYVVQTAQKIVERCILMTTDPGDLVFDPTCGSGTTAVVAEKWGRRWITCDTSRVAVTLAKQRLMTAGFDYYKLRYPAEGLKGQFIYKTVPHIMLKSIANNAAIDTIHAALHPAITAALASLNLALAAAPAFTAPQGVRKGKKVDFAKGEILLEWEVPFDWPEPWPAAAKPAFDAFHAARQTMQRAMDKSIADSATRETLYDKPEIDPSKLRVTGPFTVEAVPSPIVQSLDSAAPAPIAADASIARSGETARQAAWRDELLKTGIRGKGGQMLMIAGLETIPGCKHIHASGALADDGRRAVVSFGPEHAALEQRQVERALDEAAKLVPTPKLVIFCAFAFDPEAAKDIDEINWPGVTLLKAQMNTDLLTEDLKKARSNNQSFWLMGQPDVDVRKVGGQWQVAVKGFDYFNTKSGEIESGGTKNIAMWSLDSDYDGRAVFPRQMFFPMAGAKEGWNRLKANIRAELDGDLLDAFHGTVSLPFDAGDHNRIAVKIVDDRGIESLKIVALDD